jgi:hypothetical protein
MKKKHILITLTSIILLFTTSCIKNTQFVKDIDPIYIGSWYCYYSPYDISHIEINSNNYAYYDEERASFEGYATVKNSILKIGYRKFEIIEAPRLLDSIERINTGFTYKMELSGPFGYLASGTYYK